jgi:hypothetical protein
MDPTTDGVFIQESLERTFLGCPLDEQLLTDVQIQANLLAEPFDYKVASVERVGEVLHIKLRPKEDTYITVSLSVPESES